MNHKPNRFNDILTNIVTGVTAWGTAVILLLIKLAIWVFQ